MASQITRRRINPDDPLKAIQNLDQYVKEFAASAGFKNATPELLLKGAKTAVYGDALDSIELTDDERTALAVEREDVLRAKGFRRLTKELRVTILTCCMAAIVQGWDQASINGANQLWPQDLGLAVLDTPSLGIKRDLADVWYFGFINASPYLFAAIVGAWLSDPFNYYLGGRRRAIFVSAIFCFISVIGAACVRTPGELLACRILLGIGIGVKASLVPVYAAEISPAHVRGSLVMSWQVSVAFGILLGSACNLALFEIKRLGVQSLAWRLQLAAAAIPAIPLIVLIFVCPESPRFLMKRGRWDEAFKSLCYLNQTPLQAARELITIHAQMEAESKRWYPRHYPEIQSVALQDKGSEVAPNQDQVKPRYSAETNYRTRFVNLWSIPRIRRATVAAIVVMLSQQLCGVNIIAFYSNTITIDDLTNDTPINTADTKRRQALALSFGFGATNFLFAFPAFKTIDRAGRRALLLSTLPFLLLCLLGAGLMFLLNDDSAQIGAVAAFVILYTMFYSPGLGPVPFTYSAEAFPIVNREVGMSVAVFFNLFGAGLLGLFVPFIIGSIGALGLFCLFAGLNVVAFILIYVFVYETKGTKLEERNSTFGIETSTHLRYQLTYVLPHFLSNPLQVVSALWRGGGSGIDSLYVWILEQEEAEAERRGQHSRDGVVTE